MDIQLKQCSCCRRWKPVWAFSAALDAYTGEAKWLRNTCNRCYNGRRRVQQRAEREKMAGYRQLALL